MFTGIIQAVGKVREPEKLGDGVRLTIVTPKEFHLDEVKVGDSIACNGACMTVTGINGDEFNVDVSAESLSKTVGLNTFGCINLEKAMRLGDRVDGHLVPRQHPSRRRNLPPNRRNRPSLTPPPRQPRPRLARSRRRPQRRCLPFPPRPRPARHRCPRPARFHSRLRRRRNMPPCWQRLYQSRRPCPL